jgi:hypothetical protein
MRKVLATNASGSRPAASDKKIKLKRKLTAKEKLAAKVPLIMLPEDIRRRMRYEMGTSQ